MKEIIGFVWSFFSFAAAYFGRRALSRPRIAGGCKRGFTGEVEGWFRRSGAEVRRGAGQQMRPFPGYRGSWAIAEPILADRRSSSTMKTVLAIVTPLGNVVRNALHE
jgi:hypothetical protein